MGKRKKTHEVAPKKNVRFSLVTSEEFSKKIINLSNALVGGNYNAFLHLAVNVTELILTSKEFQNLLLNSSQKSEIASMLLKKEDLK